MISPDLLYEQSLWGKGFGLVAGVDEVGRGAWAGPLVAAAVCLSNRTVLSGVDKPQSVQLPRLLRDSKKLSASQRSLLADQLAIMASQWSIGQANVDEINSLGVGQANILAMQRALDALPLPADFALVDGAITNLMHPDKQKSIIKGDAIVASIAAASIIAKVHRDAIMIEVSKTYPEYRFDKHKGYGTKLHQQAIQKHGLSPIHRTGYNLKFMAK